jgi:secreted trypsin-like serine protease
MKTLIILTFLIQYSLAQEIIGGQPTNNLEHPWQMSLQTRWGGHFCGGVLIHKKALLTAAHCVKDFEPKELYIRGNSKNGERKRLKKYGRAKSIIIHPKFKSKYVIAHDIAIVKLKKEVRDLKPIPMADEIVFGRNLSQSFKEITDSIYVTGWGMLEPPNRLPLPSDQLMEVEVKPLGSTNVDLTTDLDLRQYIIQKYRLSESTLDYLQDHESKVLLTEGKGQISGACSGDSGGPLIVKTNNQVYLLGIASYVAGGERQCLGIAGNTNIQEYLSWIKSSI